MRTRRTIELFPQNLWSHSFKEIRLDLLLQAFGSHTFYILGAGASYPLVPLIAKIASKILAYAERFPGFPADLGVKNNVTFQRILSDDALPWSRIRSPAEALVKTGHFTTSTFDGLWRRLLAPTPLPESAAQYEVFRLARPRSILFTLNVDGIGTRYCGGRLWVIEAHGSDRADVLHSKWAEELIDTNMHDLGLWCFPNGAIPIGPEPVGIACTAPYQRAKGLFRRTEFVVLIGYSFGRRKDGGIDDHETFGFFVDLLRKYPKPLLVVDKEPALIAGELQEAASLPTVYAIQAEWNQLAQAILNVAHRSGCYDSLRLLGFCPEIQREYFGLLERSTG